MKKQNDKPTNEAQLLDLLKKVLPKATHDPRLADKIFQAVQNELAQKARAKAFEKFCARVELPNLEPKTVEAVKGRLTESFGKDAEVAIKPNRKEQTLAVEVSLPAGDHFLNEIKVRPVSVETESEEGDTLKFAPFPVCLPGDGELVWLLAKRENLTPEEAGIALAKLEEDFWGSKTGQKLIRDRVERNFPEFIARVPAGMLAECGLKRHYKEPEPIKKLERLKPQEITSDKSA